jgi:hypothetical protein
VWDIATDDQEFFTEVSNFWRFLLYILCIARDTNLTISNLFTVTNAAASTQIHGWLLHFQVLSFGDQGPEIALNFVRTALAAEMVDQKSAEDPSNWADSAGEDKVWRVIESLLIQIWYWDFADVNLVQRPLLRPLLQLPLRLQASFVAPRSLRAIYVPFWHEHDSHPNQAVVLAGANQAHLRL